MASEPIPTYPDLDADALIRRLAIVVNDLANKSTEWWRMQADECRTKAEAYLSSGEQSVAGRNRDVELATYHVTSSIYETRAELESLKEERNFLILLLGRK